MLPVADLARARLGIDQAHRAVMLEDARHVLAQNRAARQQAQQAMQPGDILSSTPAETMGNIHVGDFFQTAVPQNPEKSTLSTLAKLGMAAALVFGGASIPLGLFGAYQALKPATTPPATDNDTQFELVLPPMGEGDPQ